MSSGYDEHIVQTNELIAELQHIVELMEDGAATEEVIDEFTTQSGSIQTIISTLFVGD